VFDAFASWLQALPLALVGNFTRVLLYPLGAGQRVYWLYLASSLVLAFAAWRGSRRDGGDGGGFLRFCFPAEVWRHPSAWLDLRYFLFHQTLVRVWLYGGVVVSLSLATAAAMGSVFGASASALSLGEGVAQAPTLFERGVLTLASVAFVDLVAFGAHVLQHRVPLLWEFHRVHHSLPVMHPLSNYREHPVDNFVYASSHGVSLGIATAAAALMLGCELEAVDVLGVNAVHFAFNFLGYNLRHSHVWMRWPSWLGYVLGSPAYHQIHHSCAPQHADRNFAFLFPVWDWLFGSLYLPGERETLRFGLGDGTEGDYASVLDLYLLPFARIARGALRSAVTSQSVSVGEDRGLRARS
jgi:sterol desaturase/sphingolipid hydroxylase (fatty acid hydroxylase superfamily)